MVVVYTVEVVISTEDVDIELALPPPVAAELTPVCDAGTDVLLELLLSVDVKVVCSDEAVTGLELEPKVGCWVFAVDVAVEFMLLLFVVLTDVGLTEEGELRLITMLVTGVLDSLADVG